MERKIVIVTGASRGIGNGIATALASEGFTLVCVQQSENEEYMEAIRALSPESVCIRADISKADDEARIIDTAIERFGKIDILVNNAGVAPKEREDILNMSRESMDRLLDINLKGTFFLTQYCAKKMTELGFGEAIINITSMSAYTSSTSRGEYCISKAGLSMVTTLFADRLAEYGINVYEVRPGIIKTDMTATVNEKYDRLIGEGLLPIKRWGYPEDIGRAVVALAKGYLPYSTGEVINIDGGFHIRRL